MIVKVSLCRNDRGPIYQDEAGLWRHIDALPSGYRAVTCRLAYPDLVEVDVTCSAEPATRPVNCVVSVVPDAPVIPGQRVPA